MTTKAAIVKPGKISQKIICLTEFSAESCALAFLLLVNAAKCCAQLFHKRSRKIPSKDHKKRGFPKADYQS